ncbi:MAG: chemotaxis protein CheW [Alphaproteobacteria bacterium]
MDLSLISAESQRTKSQGEKHLVTFRVGDVHLGLPVRQVAGFIESVPVTPVPLAPSFVTGIFEWRGQTVTQIDLAHRLGLSVGDAEAGRIVLIVTSDDDIYGFPVEAVSAFLAADEGRMGKPSEIESGRLGSFCSDVFHHREARYPVLNPGRLAGTDGSGLSEEHREQVSDSREDSESPAGPKLRLVSSNLPPIAMQETGDKKPGSAALLDDLGGQDGIRRLADGIALGILDDDFLNPYLGTLDAQQLPDLIARYLIGLFGGPSDSETMRIMTRLFAGDGKNPDHADKSLAHIGNALFSADIQTGVTDGVLHRLETAWTTFFSRPSGR